MNARSNAPRPRRPSEDDYSLPETPARPTRKPRPVRHGDIEPAQVIEKLDKEIAAAARRKCPRECHFEADDVAQEMRLAILEGYSRINAKAIGASLHQAALDAVRYIRGLDHWPTGILPRGDRLGGLFYSTDRPNPGDEPVPVHPAAAAHMRQMAETYRRTTDSDGTVAAFLTAWSIRLRKADRELLIASHDLGYTRAQLAKARHVSVKTIRSHLARIVANVEVQIHSARIDAEKS